MYLLYHHLKSYLAEDAEYRVDSNIIVQTFIFEPLAAKKRTESLYDRTDRTENAVGKLYPEAFPICISRLACDIP